MTQRILALTLIFGLLGCRPGATQDEAATPKPDSVSKPYAGTYRASPQPGTSDAFGLTLTLNSDATFRLSGGFEAISGRIEEQDASHLVLHGEKINGKPTPEGVHTTVRQEGGGTTTETTHNDPMNVALNGNDLTLTPSEPGGQSVILHRDAP